MISRCVILVISFIVMSMQGSLFRVNSTTNFLIRFERSVPQEDIRKLGDKFELTYEKYQKRFGISLNRRIEVYVYNSPLRFHADSKSGLFNDGCFYKGKIYMMAPRQLQKDMKFESVLNRVVGRALLDGIKFCPAWLSECYSLYLGDNLMDFGKPAQVKVSGFEDLSEQYSTAERDKEVKEVYATMAVTGDFLVSRYGQKKMEEMLLQFAHGGTLEEIFESVFGENIDVIENEWISELQLAVKE